MRGTSHIYINGRFLCQQATGVQKFALGTALALQKKHPEIIVISPKGKHNSHGLRLKQSGIGRGFIWEQLWLPLYLWLHPHSLLINFCNSAPLLIKNQIVSIHDLAFLKKPEWFKPGFRKWYRFLIPRICKKSLRIATVTEFIKDEIIKTYAVSPEKIIILSNGIPKMEFDENKPFPYKYLLLTGIYNPRKNAGFVLSLLPEIKKKDIHIVGVGADTTVFAKVEFLQDENLHLLKYVDEKQYYTLMKHAEALAFPSEYEGFGIPVLEALIMNTPAIVPDIEVYRESFADLPLYYTLNDSKSFLQAVERINIHKPNSNELTFLKNKFNFEASVEILSELINNNISKKIKH